MKYKEKKTITNLEKDHYEDHSIEYQEPCDIVRTLNYILTLAATLFLITVFGLALGAIAHFTFSGDNSCEQINR